MTRALECRHFNGIQNTCCEAGVAYLSVRDSSSPGPYRWPCLTLIGRPTAVTGCPKRSHLTTEEQAAREAEMRALIDAHVAKIDAGECPVCGAAIEPSSVIGRCRYAACGHRLGQVLSDEE